MTRWILFTTPTYKMLFTLLSKLFLLFLESIAQCHDTIKILFSWMWSMLVVSTLSVGMVRCCNFLICYYFASVFKYPCMFCFFVKHIFLAVNCVTYYLYCRWHIVSVAQDGSSISLLSLWVFELWKYWGPTGGWRHNSPHSMVKLKVMTFSQKAGDG